VYYRYLAFSLKLTASQLKSHAKRCCQILLI
jgi:hypothetical protein